MFTTAETHTPRLSRAAETFTVRTGARTSVRVWTAEVTGAFAYMEYDDVRRFASVYDLQRKYDALQDQSVNYVAAASGPLLLLADPEEAQKRQLEDWTVKIEQALAALNVQQQLAQHLSQSYGEFLTSERH